MDISKDIKDAIQKELPAEVGNVLQERLEEISKLESDNEKLRSSLKEANSAMEKLERLVSRHKDIDKREKELSEREADICERERKMDVHDANLRAEEAEKRAELAGEYVDKIFRSPVYRTVTNKPVAVDYGQGHGSGVEQHSQTEEKTIE